MRVWTSMNSEYFHTLVAFNLLIGPSYEFGGPLGVSAMMIGFPILMYYCWICLRFYNGALVHPESFGDVGAFLGRMWVHVREVLRTIFSARTLADISIGRVSYLARFSNLHWLNHL